MQGIDQALLDAAYRARQALLAYEGVDAVEVAFRHDVVILKVHKDGQQLRIEADLEGCCAMDGDHCNADYDRD